MQGLCILLLSSITCTLTWAYLESLSFVEEMKMLVQLRTSLYDTDKKLGNLSLHCACMDMKVTGNSNELHWLQHLPFLFIMTFINGPVELICNIVVVFKPKKAIKNVIKSCSLVIGSGIREYVAHNGVLVLLFEVLQNRPTTVMIIVIYLDPGY